MWAYRKMYAEYRYAVKNIYCLCGRIANSRGLGPWTEKVDTTSALSELARLRSERAAKWEQAVTELRPIALP